MSHFIKLREKSEGPVVFVNLEMVTDIRLLPERPHEWKEDATAPPRAELCFAAKSESGVREVWIEDPDSYARLMEELEDAADREPSLQHYLEDIAMALNAVVACVDDTGVVVRHG